MLGTGKSFRTSRDADTVRQGCRARRSLRRSARCAPAASISPARSNAAAAARAKPTRSTEAAVRYASYLGRMRVVTFVPVDLQLAGGPPGARRAFLNGALSQSEPALLSRARALSQSAAAKERAAARRGSSRRRACSRFTTQRWSTPVRASSCRARDSSRSSRSAPRARTRVLRRPNDSTLRTIPNVVSESPSRRGDRGRVRATLAQRRRDRARRVKARWSGRIATISRCTLDGVALARLRLAGTAAHGGTRAQDCRIRRYERTRRTKRRCCCSTTCSRSSTKSAASAFLAEIGDYEQAFVTATHVPPGLPGGRTLGARARRRRIRRCAVLKLSPRAWREWAPDARGDGPAGDRSRPPGARSSERISRATRIRRASPTETLLVVTRSSAWSHQLSFLAERSCVSSPLARRNAGIERLRFRVGRSAGTRAGRSVAEAAARPRFRAGSAPEASSPGEALERFRQDVERQAAGQASRRVERVFRLRGAR